MQLWSNNETAAADSGDCADYDIDGCCLCKYGPAMIVPFSFIVFLTWIIGLGGRTVAVYAPTYVGIPSLMYRIFIAMIAANIASAWLGTLFVKVAMPPNPGDVTIENHYLHSGPWCMLLSCLP